MSSVRSRPTVMAWAALVVVYIVWGSTYVAIRVGVQEVPPLVLAGVRYLLAGALLLPFALRTGDAEQRRHDRIGRRAWLAAAVVGLLLPALGNGSVNVAEQHLDSGLAAMLVATVPLFMVVLAVPVRKERPGPTQLVGVLVGLAGVGVLAGVGSGSGGAFGSVVIALVAAASWAAGSVISPLLPLPSRRLVAAALEMIAGGVILVVAAAVAGEFGRLHVGDVSAHAWFAFAWLVGPGAILTFAAYLYALDHLPISTVSTYAYVNPVVAVALGVWLLDERLTSRELLGGLLIVLAVAAIVAANRRTRGRGRNSTQDVRTGSGPASARPRSSAACESDRM